MAQEEERHADHLEDETQWDLETPVEHEKARTPRALVSVSFRPEDLEIVATAAEGAGTAFYQIRFLVPIDECLAKTAS